MKMYVANCTQQVQDFIYRTIGSVTTRTQRIEIGSQVRLSGEFNTEDIDYIVSQHAKYGMVAASSIKNGPGSKKFVGVCYSVDKPVAVDSIQIAISLNTQVLIERGRETRQQAAVAVNNIIADQNTSLETLELSVVEEPKDGSEPKVAEGHRVTERENPDRSPTPPEPDRRGRGRRRN